MGMGGNGNSSARAIYVYVYMSGPILLEQENDSCIVNTKVRKSEQPFLAFLGITLNLCHDGHILFCRCETFSLIKHWFMNTFNEPTSSEDDYLHCCSIAKETDKELC